MMPNHARVPAEVTNRKDQVVKRHVLSLGIGVLAFGVACEHSLGVAIDGHIAIPFTHQAIGYVAVEAHCSLVGHAQQ